MTTDDPLAMGLLNHLATTRSAADPLGSLARTVLSGESDLRRAVTCSWHGEAMMSAFAEAMRERDRMSPAERAAYDEQAASLRASLDRRRHAAPD
jgi:hypothetical protein